MKHSAILLTCIKPKSVLKTNFWSFGEWPFYAGFVYVDSCSTVQYHYNTDLDDMVILWLPIFFTMEFCKGIKGNGHFPIIPL